jgi:hypothetical protein
MASQTKTQNKPACWLVRACAAISWAFLAISLMANAGCAAITPGVEAEAKEVGVETAKCMWKCGLGCAATLVPIPNPPPEMPSMQEASTPE